MHPIATVAPLLATLVDEAIIDHVVPGTLRTYRSATDNFSRFCMAHGVCPFPVDAVWLCSWMRVAAMSISIPSLKVYLAGIRFECGSRGLPWLHDGSEPVRRTLRFLKRRYGCLSSRAKVPVSLSLILSLCDQLEGWPCLRIMSHNDRLWVTASTIATLCFLRGGEFLSSPSSSRSILLGRHVMDASHDDGHLVSVAISRSKARWWLPFEHARCFQSPPGTLLDPVWLLRCYRSMSPVRLAPGDPAFRLADGSTLSRNWMVRRTQQLMSTAGIQVVDSLGAPIAVFASSWRAGGVKSAKDAGIGEDVIMALGRWSSCSWTSYSMTSLRDLRQAAMSMYSTPSTPPNDAEPLAHVVRVGSPATSIDPALADHDVIHMWLSGARRADGPLPPMPSFNRRAA